MFWIGKPGALVRFPVRTFDVSPANPRQLVQTLGGKFRQIPLGFRPPRVWNLSLGTSQGLTLEEVSAIRSVIELETVHVFAEHALRTNLFTPAQARFEGVEDPDWTRSDTPLGWAGWRLESSPDYNGYYNFPPVVVRPGLDLTFMCPVSNIYTGQASAYFLDAEGESLSSLYIPRVGSYMVGDFTVPENCAFVQMTVATPDDIGAPVLASNVSGFREGDGVGECILDFPIWAQPWRTDVPFLTSSFTLREVSGA